VIAFLPFDLATKVGLMVFYKKESQGYTFPMTVSTQFLSFTTP